MDSVVVIIQFWTPVACWLTRKDDIEICIDHNNDPCDLVTQTRLRESMNVDKTISLLVASSNQMLVVATATS